LMYLLFYRRDRRDYAVLAAASVIILAGVHALVDFSLEMHGYTVFFVAIVSCGLSCVLPTADTKRSS
jgi:hypothetical protein